MTGSTDNNISKNNSLIEGKNNNPEEGLPDANLSRSDAYAAAGARIES